jgi:hypothetical protein
MRSWLQTYVDKQMEIGVAVLSENDPASTGTTAIIFAPQSPLRDRRV